MDHRERRYDEESEAASLPRLNAHAHPLDGGGDGSLAERESSRGSGVSHHPREASPEDAAATHTDHLRRGGGGGFIDPLGASGAGGSGSGSGGASDASGSFDDPLRASPRGGAGASSSGSGSGHGLLSRDERAAEILNGTRGGGRMRDRDALRGGGEDGEVVVEWESRKQSILQRFSGQGTIQVSLTFDIISTREKGAKGLAARLEELDDPAKGQRAESARMSQQEYVARLRQLNDDIAHAWLASDRINALKLAIQAAKLLRDTSVPAFYPILFVLVGNTQGGPRGEVEGLGVSAEGLGVSAEGLGARVYSVQGYWV
jgi:hypothetical protein